MNGCEYEQEESEQNNKETEDEVTLFDMKRIRYGPVRCGADVSLSLSFILTSFLHTYTYTNVL